MATSPSDKAPPIVERPSPEGLLSREELALIKNVERSRVWRLLRDALCWEREKRFTALAEATDPNVLLKGVGAIELVQWLLQEGPRFVVWYRRFMDAQAEEAAVERARRRLDVGATEDLHAEREYVPEGTPADPPEFDV